MKGQFAIAGIPVRIEAAFLVLAAVLGYLMYLGPNGPHGTTLFLLFVPIATMAVLIHELGHALVARAYGMSPFIVLHGMGGLTTFDPRQASTPLTHGRRILITFAGPAAGIVVGVPLLVVQGLIAPDPFTHALLDGVVFTTLGWGVLNLFPMLPLDGGHIVATVLDKLVGRRGVAVARLVSIGMAVVLGLGLVLFTGVWFNALILGVLAYGNWRAYQAEKRGASDEALLGPLKDAVAALEAGDAPRARQLAEAIRERASSPEVAARAAHVLAWSHLVTGDAEGARQALASAPSGHPPDAFLEGAVLLAAGRASDAIGPLVEAIVGRDEEAVSDALASAIARAGRMDELVGLLESKERSERAGPVPLQRVAHRLFTEGHVELAGELYERLFARFGDALDAFNAACARARTGERSRALGLLERALDAGLPDPSVLDSDEDLAPLRGSAEMDALRARAGLTG